MYISDRPKSSLDALILSLSHSPHRRPSQPANLDYCQILMRDLTLIGDTDIYGVPDRVWWDIIEFFWGIVEAIDAAPDLLLLFLGLGQSGSSHSQSYGPRFLGRCTLLSGTSSAHHPIACLLVVVVEACLRSGPRLPWPMSSSGGRWLLVIWYSPHAGSNLCICLSKVCNVVGTHLTECLITKA